MGKPFVVRGTSGIVHSAFHVVSAYAVQNRLCLGQSTVQEKANEIVAIPKLLDLLEVQGCTITIDAMGCQKEIADKIIEKRADYILMVKNNQEELKSQVEKMFRLQKDCPRNQAVDSAHGRVETRTCQVINDLTFMDGTEQWNSLKSIVQVTSERYNKKTRQSSIEIRHYISSLVASPGQMNSAVRSHWGIENSLHWVLDVIFNEDSSLKKKDHSPVNFNMTVKVALALLEQEQTFKASKNGKRQRAALNDNYRQKILKC